MQYSIAFRKIRWFDKEPFTDYMGRTMFPNCEGMVVYTIRVVGKESPDFNHEYDLYQPFSSRGQGRCENGNVWGWNGNREKPTLSPSFKATFGKEEIFHIFFREGKIVDAGSTNVGTVPQ